MKKRIYLLSSLVLTAFLFFACSGTDYNDDDTTTVVLPILTTVNASNITDTSTTSGGVITSDGGVPITKSGVVYSTTAAPTLINTKTTDGLGFGTYTSSITGLTGNTTYYARAYATNVAGTGYGNEITFKTGPIVSTVATTTATAITVDKATTGGNISSDGGSPVTERGVVWDIVENPTVDDVTHKIPDAAGGTGTFVSNLTGLDAATKYYVRAYAINGIGISYGTQISFTTSNN